MGGLREKSAGRRTPVCGAWGSPGKQETKCNSLDLGGRCAGPVGASGPGEVAGVREGRESWRRRADSNRRIGVLQTPALDHLATSPRCWPAFVRQSWKPCWVRASGYGPGARDRVGVGDPTGMASHALAGWCHGRSKQRPYGWLGWCRGRDSNPHALNGHSALNAACLPFQHLGVRCGDFSGGCLSRAACRSRAHVAPAPGSAGPGVQRLPGPGRSRPPGTAATAGLDLAGAGGLEPPACGFGDRCSSQLSYAPPETQQGASALASAACPELESYRAEAALDKRVAPADSKGSPWSAVTHAATVEALDTVILSEEPEGPERRICFRMTGAILMSVREEILRPIRASE